MNAYLITFKKNKYITNADNVMEAEEKFLEQYELNWDCGVYDIEEIEINDSVRSNKKIKFF